MNSIKIVLLHKWINIFDLNFTKKWIHIKLRSKLVVSKKFISHCWFVRRKKYHSVPTIRIKKVHLHQQIKNIFSKRNEKPLFFSKVIVIFFLNANAFFCVVILKKMQNHRQKKSQLYHKIFWKIDNKRNLFCRMLNNSDTHKIVSLRPWKTIFDIVFFSTFRFLFFAIQLSSFFWTHNNWREKKTSKLNLKTAAAENKHNDQNWNSHNFNYVKKAWWTNELHVIWSDCWCLRE